MFAILKNKENFTKLALALPIIAIAVLLNFNFSYAADITIGAGGGDPGSPTEGTTNSDPGSPTEGTTNSDPGDHVTSSFKLRNPLNADSLSGLIQDVIRILIQIGLSISVLFIVYAGYLFVTAGGSSEKVTKAKEVFLWAVIGTAILLGALVIMEVIQNTIKQVTNKP